MLSGLVALWALAACGSDDASSPAEPASGGQGGSATAGAGGSQAGSSQGGQGGSPQAGSGGSSQAGSGGSGAEAGQGGSSQAGSGGSSQAGEAGSGGSAQAGSAGSEQGGSEQGGSGGAGGSPQGGSAGASGSSGQSGSSQGGSSQGGSAQAGAGQGGGGQGGAGAGGSGTLLPAQVLAEKKGEFFTPTVEQPLLKINLAQKGTTYGRLRISFDLRTGQWQPIGPNGTDPARLDHILFGLFRANQPQSYQRYLMGAGAIVFKSKSPVFRMFGRKEFAQGYTSYTSWSATYAWQLGGKLYHLDCVFDGVAQKQSCELSLGGSVVKTLNGSIPYIDAASHLTSGFYLELGRGAPEGEPIETAPIGWTYSDLRVEGQQLAP